ncbi:MAG: amidohydrolase family protein [Myxococcales bacterium]|nr:amidohydrolase family protein [Myxococcales bacterium]
MIIDAHVHVGRWDHADFLGRQVTLQQTVGVLEQAGCSGAAICPTDRCENAALLADAKAVLDSGYGGKLWVMPWVRPGDNSDASTAFLTEHLHEIGGMKIHPSLSRVRITDDAFAPMLELAHRHSKVVLVHCGRWQEIASYRFAVEAATRYPHAKFLLAHAGGDTPPLATAAAELVAEECVDNVWFEFSGCREYWVIERNCRLLGAERYLMGSDYCLAHPLMYIGAVRGMNLSEDEKDKILGGNALSLFGESLKGSAS